MTQCIFCDKELSIFPISTGGFYDCHCPICGTYRITEEALADLPYEFSKHHSDKLFLARGYIREMSDLKLQIPSITTTNYVFLFNNNLIPKNTMDRLYKLLQSLYRRANIINSPVLLDMNIDNSSLGYAKNTADLSGMLTALSTLNYITLPNSYSGHLPITLTIQGISKVEELNHTNHSSSKQAFVAMMFNEFMFSAYSNSISKAIADTGYTPVIISEKEHNDNICDHIIAEIRKSKFIVADFTGNRGGVYFEAGFAYGLGLPVIWTCHASWFNANIEKILPTPDGNEVTVLEHNKIHFDIDHYNFIVWETEEELYAKLKLRIEATII